MKYIRTENGIYDLEEKDNKGIHTAQIVDYVEKECYGGKTGRVVLIPEKANKKFSDNLEELFDVFYVDIDNHPFDMTHMFDNFEKALEDAKDFQSYSDRKELGYDIIIYGLIKKIEDFTYGFTALAKATKETEWELTLNLWK